MKTALKAALAATAGGGLLLGGAGSLAYWTDDEELQPETDLVSGTLDLGAPTCGDWLLDDASTFTPATDRIVPGDSLTRTCQFLITGVGDHLEAALSADLATAQDSALEDELTVSAAYEIDTDATDDDTNETSVDPEAGPVAFTDADNGSYLRATVSVAFAFGTEDNDSNGGVTATLDDIVVTATQTDSH